MSSTCARLGGTTALIGHQLVRIPIRDQGEFPKVVLATSESDLGPDMFEEPVVEEADRTTCGDRPVRDTYVPDPAIRAAASRTS